METSSFTQLIPWLDDPKAGLSWSCLPEYLQVLSCGLSLWLGLCTACSRVLRGRSHEEVSARRAVIPRKPGGICMAFEKPKKSCTNTYSSSSKPFTQVPGQATPHHSLVGLTKIWGFCFKPSKSLVAFPEYKHVSPYLLIPKGLSVCIFV